MRSGRAGWMLVAAFLVGGGGGLRPARAQAEDAPSGAFRATFCDDLQNVEGFATGPDGRLYLCDWTANRIQRYDNAGALVGVFTAEGGMKAPNSLAFGPLPPSAAGAARAGEAGSGPASEPGPPHPVDQVDLERYAGLWYQIALIPNRFQKQCVRGATAEYTLRKDGRIDVINRCLKADGTVSEARGVAKVVDPATHAKLKVSFVSFLGIRPFWGDYWILDLDPDYRWVVVGTRDRKYGWILARAPELAPDVLEAIRGRIRAQGYDPDAFAPSPP